MGAQKGKQANKDVKIKKNVKKKKVKGVIVILSLLCGVQLTIISFVPPSPLFVFFFLAGAAPGGPGYNFAQQILAGGCMGAG